MQLRSIKLTLRLVLALALLCISIATSVWAADTYPLPGQGLKTPVQPELIDPTAFTEWQGGKEQAPAGRDADRGPLWLLWTNSKERVGHSGLTFGTEQQPGPRHLRIGFKEAIPVGTVLTRGDIQLSVLKHEAPYPGNLSNNDQWIPGRRLADGAITTAQAERDECVLWVLPAGTTTRALRFTRDAKPADAKYEGWLGGAVVLRERFLNLAPFALAASKSNNRHAPKVTNGETDSWGCWANVSDSSEDLDKRPVISADHPEWIQLTWPKPVALNGLVTIWTGFGAANIQAYTGPDDLHPRDASDTDWATVASPSGFECGYPATLWPVFLPLGRTVETRAIRLQITGVTPAGHPHVQRRPAGGRRVWLGEVFAVRDIGADVLQTPNLTVAAEDVPHAPIPVPFTLPEEGYVTLVIEDQNGMRVRNLVSETWFPAGENVAWWDGTDDLGRDVDAADHGLYNIPAKFVKPGRYSAHGLWRKEIEPFFEFAVYSTGSPPWSTPDHTGAWLANHSPPQAAVFVPATHSPTGEPAVFLGCYVTEGPDGFAWVDLDGRKRGGMKWIGGNWTAAPYLGRDTSPNADPKTAAYVASVWETAKKSGIHELRINALEVEDGNRLNVRPVLTERVDRLGEQGSPLTPQVDRSTIMRGISAYDGVLACSLNPMHQILFVDAGSGETLGSAFVEDPRGLTYDREGRLLVLSGKQVVRFEKGDRSNLPGRPEGCFAQIGPVPFFGGLEDPFALALDGYGNIYVSDHGGSHQVKVYSPKGKFLRAIGRAGKPKAGPYDPLHMNHPAGIAVDSQNQLWVTEHDSTPKRVSVWSREGEFIRAFYGPGKYGGGGQLDPHDSSRFYYADEGRGTLEFKLDWEQGSAELVSVLYRHDPDGVTFPFRTAAPETAIYRKTGREPLGKTQRYFTNCFNTNPTQGHNTAVLFIERDGVAHPAVIMGLAHDWELLKTEPFRALWPEGADPDGDKWRNDGQNQALFIWSDLNDDGEPQADELKFHHTPVSGVTVMEDLSFCLARVGRETPLATDSRDFDTSRVFQRPTGAGLLHPSGSSQLAVALPPCALRLRPVSFTPSGVPLYDFSQSLSLDVGWDSVPINSRKNFGVGTESQPTPSAARDNLRTSSPAEVLATGVHRGRSTGGSQVLADDSDEAVITLGVEPFDPYSVSGIKAGKAVWSYPNPWPGLHASHHAAKPDRPGQLIGVTRLLGHFVNPKGSEVGPLWAVNGNMGNLYLLTRDGLFVGTVFEDVRQGKLWKMAVAQRGMSLKSISLHDENFWPSISQTQDGQVYLVDGSNCSLVRLDGLESLRRIAPIRVTVTADDLAQSQQFVMERESLRQKSVGRGILKAEIRETAPEVDGELSDWAAAEWVEIDKRGAGANFNSNAKPYDIRGALAVSGNRLYAAWDTQELVLLQNSGELPGTLFKTGGALDLMLGTDPQADLQRRTPVAGDLRLLVTRVNDQTRATLYRQIVPGTAEADRVPFSSPWRTITFDRVQDVSDQIKLAGDHEGHYEISVPLTLLGLRPVPGMKLRGDIGILRGNGTETTARSYWSNKATAITADVPSEAALTPHLWGTIQWE